MTDTDALPFLQMLDALSQPTRLAAFRLLVKASAPIPAGEIATALGVPANTLSTHLAILERSGLLHSYRQGRSIRYRARLDALRALIAFMVIDCCGGDTGRCGSLLADLVPSC